MCCWIALAVYVIVRMCLQLAVMTIKRVVSLTDGYYLIPTLSSLYSLLHLWVSCGLSLNQYWNLNFVIRLLYALLSSYNRLAYLRLHNCKYTHIWFVKSGQNHGSMWIGFSGFVFFLQCWLFIYSIAVYHWLSLHLMLILLLVFSLLWSITNQYYNIYFSLTSRKT